MRLIHSRRSKQESANTPPAARKHRHAGIYLLPNLFTTGSLFAGFYGVVAAINSLFDIAAIAIIIAMLLDGIDGRVARLTNTQSDLGAEYDSLADMVSFGLAPALIVYYWSLSGLGKLGWLAAFLYTAATALRLARFNTQTDKTDKQFFQGLPSPAAAGLVAAVIWFGSLFDFRESGTMVVATLIVTIGAALLMVSNVRYYSFKDFDLRGRVPFVSILAVVMVFILVSLEPAVILLVIFAAYTLSGPVLTWRQRRRKKETNREVKRA